MGKPTRVEIAWAARAINEQIDLIEEITRDGGRHEASKSAQWRDTALRMQKAIGLLRRAQQPLPDRLTANWGWYRACGWHSEPDRRHG